MSDSLSPSSTVVATSDHVSSDLAGEKVVLDLDEEIYYGLNEVGADVWARVSSPNRIAEICDDLNEKYEVDPDVLERDILRLLAEMREHGLIKVISDESSE